jgi:hypothetical protein
MMYVILLALQASPLLPYAANMTNRVYTAALATIGDESLSGP